MITKSILTMILMISLASAGSDRLESERTPVPYGGFHILGMSIEYPPIAVRAGFEGTVTVLAYIDERGTVTEASIQDGSYKCLNEAALEGVLATRFKPARQYGRPMGVWIAIPVRFEL